MFNFDSINSLRLHAVLQTAFTRRAENPCRVTSKQPIGFRLTHCGLLCVFILAYSACLLRRTVRAVYCSLVTSKLCVTHTEAAMRNSTTNARIVKHFFTRIAGTDSKWCCICGNEYKQRDNKGYTNLLNHLKAEHANYACSRLQRTSKIFAAKITHS